MSTSKVIRRVGTLALTAAILFGAAAARADVECGDVITGDAKMMVDLHCPAHDPAVTVVGGTLDMNGRTISGCPGVGVMLSFEKSTVKNGTVTGCTTGFQAEGLGKHHLENVVADSNTGVGFHLIEHVDKNELVNAHALSNGDNGFEILSEKNTVRWSTAIGNGWFGFVAGAPANDNTFLDSTASDNVFDGFLGTRATFKRCHAQNNATGFRGLKNTIKESTATGNQSWGYNMGSSGKVTDSIAANNQGGGFLIQNDSTLIRVTASNNVPDGVVSLGEGNVIREATVSGHPGDGITILAAAPDTKVQDSRVFGNQIGIRDEAEATHVSDNVFVGNAEFDVRRLPDGCAQSVWTGNVFGTTNLICIVVDP